GLAIGFCGGLAWEAMMAAAAPGFLHGYRLTAPDGRGAHPLLEQSFYWLALHFGPLIAVCVIARAKFGALGASRSFGFAWPVMVQNHADLALRAIAHRQLQPQFDSAALRRRLAQNSVRRAA